MARLSKRTPEVGDRFLAALSDGLSVTAAAIAAGARRSAMYGWRAEDPLFAEAWDEAIEEGTDKLEDEARRRAMAGSDHLLMFMLRARRPMQYRERSVHEHTGPSGGAVQFEVANAREELARRINEIVARQEAFEARDDLKGLQ